MFSAYFVFHCLNMFCFWKTSVKIFGYSFWLLAWAASFGYSFWRLASRESKPWVHTEGFRDSLITRQSQNAQNQLFKELFSWETCFKPLSSSLKPLFQYFYIKTQPIWIFFNSINISKVILNSFYWFWSLDYALESFVLLVGIFIIGVRKT